MIYFISDTHGGENMAGIDTFMPADIKKDLVIHLGDVGHLWDDTPENRQFTQWLLSREYQLAYLDGNHENFDRISDYPIEHWQGGKVRRAGKNVVHLLRGEIYTIDNQTFFVMGGCRSSDHWRAEKPWWPQEEPTKEEFDNAYANLKRHDYQVDYILTHKYFTPQQYAGDFGKYTVEGLHKFIDENVTYKKWYSGHWHKAYEIDKKHRVVFTHPVPLE